MRTLKPKVQCFENEILSPMAVFWYAEFMSSHNKIDVFFLSVNYRGSIGFGQSSLLSLPGNIGSQDVKDVQVRKNTI